MSRGLGDVYKRQVIVRRKATGADMGYKDKIIKLLDMIGESRLKEVYNFLLFCYLKGGF